MLTRRVALPLAALTAFATLPVLAAAPAGASSAVMRPTARGGDNGDPQGPSQADEEHDEEQKDNCPTELWTIPIEVKGLACVLLLPKPEKQNGGDEESSGSGLGDLLG